MQDSQVIREHIRASWRDVTQVAVEVDQAAARERSENGRMSIGIERVAARVVQRQTEPKAYAFAYFLCCCSHSLRSEQIQSPELIILAKLAPVRAGRPYLPSLHFVLPDKSYFTCLESIVASR